MKNFTNENIDGKESVDHVSSKVLKNRDKIKKLKIKMLSSE